MSETIINVEGLGKEYVISHEGRESYTALRDVISKKAKGLIKRSASNQKSKESFWALNDVNFKINQGDAVGIIGRNGAGKSTLLKILSRITEPSKGRISIDGRIASLLEVGTGFHPELTGRENIYLNGAILGMTRQEIRRKFDEIVDFSGVEKFLDTPVKRYSSGMYVRLAFAVAAHLEPEILVVDEVLAVGDAEFQKKCLGKMNDVTRNEGRTVLFVSHNMGAVASLCNRSIVMNRGQVVFDGTVANGLDYYINTGNQLQLSEYQNASPKDTDILQVNIRNITGASASSFNFSEDIIIEFKIRLQERYRNAILGFRVKDQTERNIFSSEFKLDEIFVREGVYKIQTIIPGKILVPNKYTPIIALHVLNTEVISYLEDKVNFEIEETGTEFFQYTGSDFGCVFVDCQWNQIDNRS